MLVRIAVALTALLLAALAATPGARADVGSAGDFRTATAIEVPPFRGLEPQLRLEYSSNAANGWLGVGWNLVGTSQVTRGVPGRGTPTYGQGDVFFLDGIELRPCTFAVTSSPSCQFPAGGQLQPYTSTIEGYQRIAYDPGGDRWIVWRTTGVRLTYARGHAGAGGQAFSWDLSTVEDPLGNTVRYAYVADPGEGGERHLDTISYGKAVIRFHPQRRRDRYSYATGAGLVGVRTLLESIEVRVAGQRARAYALRYAYRKKSTGRAFLTTVKRYGRDAKLTAGGTVRGGTSLPSVRYAPAPAAGRRAGEWAGAARETGQWGPPWPPGAAAANTNFDADTSILWYLKRRYRQWLAIDVDGNGRSDFVNVFLEQDPFTAGRWWVAFDIALTQEDGKGPAAYRRQTFSTDRSSMGGPLGWLWAGDPEQDFLRVVPGDVNGDHLTDLMVVKRATTPGSVAPMFLYTAISLGDGRFELPAAPAPLQLAWDPRNRFFAGDVDADGRSDLMVAARHLGCHANGGCGCATGGQNEHAGLHVAFSNGDGTYRPATEETCWSFLEWDDAHWFSGDVDGDGRRDFLRAVNHEPHTTGAAKHVAFQVALSRGDGTFVLRTQDTAVPWSTYQHPIPYFDQPLGSDLAHAGDFDGDGTTDMVVARSTGAQAGGPPPRVVLLSALSRGDGTFRLTDHDTKNSVGGTGLHSHTLNYWLSVRAGTPHFPNRWLVGDFDADGASDLLVVSPGDYDVTQWTTTGTNPRLRMLLSNRRGGWRAQPAHTKNWFHDCLDRSLTINGETCPNELSAYYMTGDVNGDGAEDLMYAGRNVVSSGDARTSLRVDLSPPSGADTFRFLPGEADGDGRTDLVYGSGTGAGVRITTLLRRPDSAGGGWTMRSQTQSVSPALIHPATGAWRLADVGSAASAAPDGLEDLLHISEQPSATGAAVVRVYTFLATGDGSWAPRVSDPIAVGGHGVRGWLTVDADGDGRQDLTRVDYDRGTAPGLLVTTLLSAGDGRWTPVSDKPWPAFESTDTGGWSLADVNGDGRGDLWHAGTPPGGTALRVHVLFAQGSGKWRAAAPQDVALGFALADVRNVRAGDVNGDGRADLTYVRPRGSGLEVSALVGHGDGRWKVASHPAWPGFTDPRPQDWRAMDVTNDGRSDLVHVGSLRCTSTNVRICTEPYDALLLRTLVADGDGDWVAAAPELVAAGDVPRTAAGWRQAEVDGLPASDLIRVDHAEPVLRVSTLLPRTPDDAIARVRNGVGATTAVTYRGSDHASPSDPARGCFLPPGTALSLAATVTTTTAGPAATHDDAGHDFRCARWSFRHRTFLGFKTTITEGAPHPNRGRSRVVRRYDVSDECLSRQRDEMVEDALGRPLERLLTAFDPPGAQPPYRCRVLYHNRLKYDPGGDAQNAYRYFSYDDFGNVTHVLDQGDPRVSQDDRTTYRGYHPATGPWLVSLPAFEQVFEGVSPSTTMRRSTFFCYDGDNGGDAVNCPGVPTRGLLTAVQAVDDRGFYDTTTYLHDTVGNVAAVIDPQHHGRAIFYDADQRLFPVASCNALSQCTDMVWDPVIGQLKEVKDPNKKVLTLDYDALGRFIGATLPTGAKTHRDYVAWGDARRQSVRERQEDGSADDLWSRTYFDGLGRSYRTVREGDGPGRTFTQRTRWTGAAQLIEGRSDWFRAGSTKHPYETFEYDALGRPVSQKHADGAALTWSYGTVGHEAWVTSRDERGNATRTYSDAHGRLSRIVELDSSGAADPTTRFRYDAADQLTSVTGPTGTATTFAWDLLGNNMRVDDPNLGPRVYGYDRAGNVRTLTDARNRTLTFEYDPLDRLQRKLYPGGAEVRWRYDEPGHGAGIGRLTSMFDPSAAGCPDGRAESLGYDGLGNVETQQKCVEGVTRQTGYGHDTLGRLHSVTYPGGDVVMHDYDDAGRLRTASGYVTDIGYDAAGRTTRIDYANGTQARMRYDPKRGWLRRSRVLRGKAVVFDARYEFFPNGLVRETSSPTNAMDDAFAYDRRNRLTDVTGDDAQSFAYDASGNMTFNSRVGTYTYPLPGAACGTPTAPAQCEQPHGVRTAGPLEYAYDDNGNLSSVHDTVTDRYSGIDWTLDQQPAVAADFDGAQTHFIYDGWTDRVVRRSGAETVRTFGPHFEETSSGPVKSIFAGELLVAEEANGAKRWLHGDRLGSTRVVTDDQGAVKRRYDYSAFGETVRGPGTAETDRRLRGERADNGLGLIELGARMYDPRLGRFISADSIVPDILNPQSLNRYAYTFNDPLSFTDPTGHDPEAPPDAEEAEEPGDDIEGPDPQLVDQFPMGMDLVSNKGWYTDDEGRLHIIDLGNEEDEGAGDTEMDDTGSVLEQITEHQAFEQIAGSPLSSAGIRSENLDRPRDLYLNERAAAYAGAGYTEFAELVEAGHACAACHLTVALGHVPTNDELDLERYNRVALLSVVARETVMLGITIGNRLANKPTSPADRLPPYNGKKTQGVFVGPGGGERPLTSGYAGPSKTIPKGTRGFNNHVKAHVEAHSAAIMRQEKIAEATVYINRANPCMSKVGCNAMLPRMLPPGAKLTVVGTNGFRKTYTGLPEK